MNIPKKDIGKPKATQKATRVFKNSDKNNKTNNMPAMAFFVSNSVRWFNVIDKSLTTSNRTLLYFWLYASMYSFTWSAEEIRSSLLVLVIVILTESC